jgi:hypothetical protein
VAGNAVQKVADRHSIVSCLLIQYLGINWRVPDFSKVKNGEQAK